MTLLLKNKDLVNLATTNECIDAIETAFIGMGRGEAREIPRRRIYEKRRDQADWFYWFNEMAGIVPSINTMALRLISATVSLDSKRGNARLGFPGPFSGLVFVFDTESSELLTVMQDFYLNPIRVAATSAIVTRRMARGDSKVMGLFGSGTQALLQAECTAAVTGIEEIHIYSTKKERRERVARQIEEKLGIRTISVDQAEGAVRGCDIVTTATSSNEPVFRGEWLEQGTHVNTMIGSDYFVPRRETDDITVFKANIIVVNSKESVRLDKQPELYPHLCQGKLHWEDIYDIGELLVRKRLFGRSMNQQITYHNNNVGMGIQFAALGRLLYDRAKSKGLGTEVDSGFFVQYDEDLRAIRDSAFLGHAKRPVEV